MSLPVLSLLGVAVAAHSVGADTRRERSPWPQVPCCIAKSNVNMAKQRVCNAQYSATDTHYCNMHCCTALYLSLHAHATENVRPVAQSANSNEGGIEVAAQSSVNEFIRMKTYL